MSDLGIIRFNIPQLYIWRQSSFVYLLGVTMQHMISMKHIDIRKYIDDIFNPNKVWLFLRDWWEGANRHSDISAKTCATILLERRSCGTPVHTPGKLDWLCRCTVHTEQQSMVGMYGARCKASFFVHVYVPESYVQSATGKLPKYFVLEWVWHAPCMHSMNAWWLQNVSYSYLLKKI